MRIWGRGRGAFDLRQRNIYNTCSELFYVIINKNQFILILNTYLFGLPVANGNVKNWKILNFTNSLSLDLGKESDFRFQRVLWLYLFVALMTGGEALKLHLLLCLFV